MVEITTVDYSRFDTEMEQVTKDPEPLFGQLGYSINGKYQIYVDGHPEKYYVRFPDGTFQECYHRGRVAPQPDLPVEVLYNRQGLPYINDFDVKLAEEYSPGNSYTFGVGPHSHHRFSGMEFPIDLRLIYQLNCRAVGGMVVEVLPGFYAWDNQLHHWNGGQIDLTSYQPATTSYHRWAIVGIDPSVPEISVETSAEQLGLNELVKSDLESFTFLSDGKIPLVAVQLRNPQNYLAESDFESLLNITVQNGSGGSFDASTILHDEGYIMIDPVLGVLTDE